MSKPNYDSTVARIAGNLLSKGSIGQFYLGHTDLSITEKGQVAWAVAIAREVVAEVKRGDAAPGCGDGRENPCA